MVLNNADVITGFALKDENRFIGTGRGGSFSDNRFVWRLKKKQEESKEELKEELKFDLVFSNDF